MPWKVKKGDIMPSSLFNLLVTIDSICNWTFGHINHSDQGELTPDFTRIFATELKSDNLAPPNICPLSLNKIQV